MLKNLVDKYPAKNIFVIDKNMTTSHPLNAADLLITKYSTIGLEAMLFNKPVVSVFLDKEEKFMIYGNAVECVTDIESLDILLKKLDSDSEYRGKWSGDINQRAEQYVREYLGVRERDSSVLAAEAIDSFIIKRYGNIGSYNANA
jgi:CDP-glycerol glycerophosphotransferase (TagB/SpsB family)